MTMKYFALALLLFSPSFARPFQVQVKNGGAYTVVADFEYYHPGNPNVQTEGNAATAGHSTTFTFPENAVNMSVRMWQVLGSDITRTLRQPEHDHCRDNGEELYFGGSWNTCCHNEHTGNGHHTEANHGAGTENEKHVFRWASNPGYNMRIRLKGTWFKGEVAAIQCREQHDEDHFESRVITCPQGDESMENILRTGTKWDTKYYYGERGDHAYDPHNHFSEGNRRFIRCHDPRPAGTNFHRFCGTSYLDIAMNPRAPRVPTPNLQDRLAWVEVPAPSAAEARMNAERLAERQLRLNAERLTEREQRAREIERREKAALEVQLAALQAQMRTMQEAAAHEAAAHEASD